MAAQRWWITLTDDQYGYMYAEKKPLPFDRVTIWVQVPPATRPHQVTGNVSKVWDGN
ncbi:hypothetical protein KNT87_gp003 [Erwinia phage Cronus]|uniref:Uncharacterized protein n=1 Tax=Erwinia phage Cronus TaxID=2163633 RepID=A0A2S1GM31_9CAUD|nr:hypothetical protein KNT87_gp003 [Erwinia phage Cronus]AWD90442.1 hypothetical protein [Erwinia phage Cronus]